MPRPSTFASRPEAAFPVLSRLLWQALALGALVSLALLALPLAPGGAATFGFLPFWLLAAPAAALLTLHRRFLATAWRAHLVRATPRRRQRFGGSPVRRFSRARRGASSQAA
ncbi:hypothetical protein GCM10011521_16740 [Arenimonas soli]|uniref:Uncharacterized protein n=1 Tax=Arenimonas soli TaxID=2269504 RepID=A0ABQ1HID4_9GAMM|nr:hypothetical protein [Arenimonas soli]GGA79153.1 hypothetical protein GCM10011521_16740 [Arenimonas soli]